MPSRSAAQHQTFHLTPRQAELLGGAPDRQAMVDHGLNHLEPIEFAHRHRDGLWLAHRGLRSRTDGKPPACQSRQGGTTCLFGSGTTILFGSGTTILFGRDTAGSHNVCYVKSLIRLRNPMLAQHSGKKLLYRVMRAGFAAQP
ncbi:hypothetical protein CO2235_150190 [Cupriavidus oxalaticus]|uniref:Uncharacterized protein n=1 Tax=Cupriavidus oxalaticus TaxID=96344 RepID=A0A375G0J3_9BURK|nr:hypothetical protein CO2235_U590059 [Cupriavidus oxalaticus]SPC12535.1 hypothetical protein CO2235_150190 [Cupriavidus oxalaticus]